MSCGTGSLLSVAHAMSHFTLIPPGGRYCGIIQLQEVGIAVLFSYLQSWHLPYGVDLRTNDSNNKKCKELHGVSQNYCCCHPHSLDEKLEAQRCKIACPKLHSCE